MARFTVLIVTVVLAFLMAAPMPGVTAKKYTVGDNKFWNPNINYTNWAKGKHFYLDDWLCTFSLLSQSTLSDLFLLDLIWNGFRFKSINSFKVFIFFLPKFFAFRVFTMPLQLVKAHQFCVYGDRFDSQNCFLISPDLVITHA